MPKGIVTTTNAGKKYKLVAREEAGFVPCPGEAHSNPYIDNCSICAPEWGKIMSYKPTPLSALTEGIAVPVGQHEETFEAAETAAEIKVVEVVEKTRAATRYFYAYVLA